MTAEHHVPMGTSGLETNSSSSSGSRVGMTFSDCVLWVQESDAWRKGYTNRIDIDATLEAWGALWADGETSVLPGNVK